jgi:hypothetical protein
LGAGLLFGLTNGSAAFGRRILIGGAPFGPVGVRAFEGFVGVDIFSVQLRWHGCRKRCDLVITSTLKRVTVNDSKELQPEICDRGSWWKVVRDGKSKDEEMCLESRGMTASLVSSVPGILLYRNLNSIV